MATIFGWLFEQIAFATGTHPFQTGKVLYPKDTADSSTPSGTETDQIDPAIDGLPSDDESEPDQDDFPKLENAGLKQLVTPYPAGGHSPEWCDFKWKKKGRLRYDQDWLDVGWKNKDVLFSEALSNYRARIKKAGVEGGGGVWVPRLDNLEKYFSAVIGPTKEAVKERSQEDIDSGRLIKIPWQGRRFKYPEWASNGKAWIGVWRSGAGGAMGGSTLCLTAPDGRQDDDAERSDYYFQRGYLRIKNPRWDAIRNHDGVFRIDLEPVTRVDLWFTSKRKKIIPQETVEGEIGAKAGDIADWAGDKAEDFFSDYFGL